MRFDLELVDVSDLAKDTEFKVFTAALEAGGQVKVIRVPGGAKLPRRTTDELAEWVKQFGAGGLPVTKIEDGQFATGVAKFVQPIKDALIQRVGGEHGDLLCFGVSAKASIVARTLGELRLRLGREMDLIDRTQWKWLWVVDFPLFEYNEDEKRWESMHHMFTAPKPEHADLLDTNPGSVLSQHFDLVVNGAELCSGSIRIHNADVQRKVFDMCGFSEDKARQQFGFLLDALAYGAPPHGGIAPGLDRIVMQLTGTDNIRDVIAFPKTQTGADLMSDAPSPVDDKQLHELHLRLALPRETPTPTRT